MPACPSFRCHSQHSVARASRQVATCGPSEKSTIYRSPFQTPRKTMELSLTIETRQPYLPKSTKRSRSQSIDTNIRLYPRDSTSMTLSIYWSREIATLPRPNTLLLPLSANVIVFFDEGLREDSMRIFLSPVM